MISKRQSQVFGGGERCCRGLGDLGRLCLEVILLLSFASAFAGWVAAQQASSQAASVQNRGDYFPARFDWQHKQPQEAGMDSARLNQAIQQATTTENVASRDISTYLATTFGATEPYFTTIGPVQARGPAAGLIVRHGYIVAEWGEPQGVDMTFSVTKTFLTTLVGLVWQRGLIHDVNDYARDYMPAGVAPRHRRDSQFRRRRKPHDQRPHHADDYCQ